MDRIKNRTEKLIALLDSSEPHEVFSAIQNLKKLHGRKANEILNRDFIDTSNKYSSEDKSKYVSLQYENTYLKRRIGEMEDELKDCRAEIEYLYNKQEYLIKENETLKLKKEKIEKYNDLVGKYNNVLKENKKLLALQKKDKVDSVKEKQSLNAKNSALQSDLKTAKQAQINNDYKSNVEKAIRQLFCNSVVGESENPNDFYSSAELMRYFKAYYFGASVTNVMFTKVFKTVFNIKRSHRGGENKAQAGLRIKVKKYSVLEQAVKEYRGEQNE